MTHKSLLRYIFRQHPQRKNHESMAQTLVTKHHLGSHLDIPSSLVQKTIVLESSSQTAAPTHAKIVEPNFSALEDIAEEEVVVVGASNCNSDDDGSSLSTSTTTFTPSLTDTLAALNIDIETFTTRELATAMLSEAQSAVKAHLETLDDTLVLLSVLAGSHGAVGLWEKEMRQRKRVWEERKGVLEDAGKAIAEMLFSEEVDGGDGMM